jgi:hypothetical protein
MIRIKGMIADDPLTLARWVSFNFHRVDSQSSLWCMAAPGAPNYPIRKGQLITVTGDGHGGQFTFYSVEIEAEPPHKRESFHGPTHHALAVESKRSCGLRRATPERSGLREIPAQPKPVCGSPGAGGSRLPAKAFHRCAAKRCQRDLGSKLDECRAWNCPAACCCLVPSSCRLNEQRNQLAVFVTITNAQQFFRLELR